MIVTKNGRLRLAFQCDRKDLTHIFFHCAGIRTSIPLLQLLPSPLLIPGHPALAP
jgi:hypothetical protein